MSCYISGKVWILAHLSMAFIIELTVMYIHILLCIICILSIVFNPHWCRFIRYIVNCYPSPPYQEELEPERRIYFYSIGLVMKEAILIFVYISLSFMYKWFRLVPDKYMVTPIDFYQWSTEALLLPKVFTGTFYIGTMQSFIYIYRKFFHFAILLKIPVFVLMRYAKSQRDFFLNDLKATYFHILCKESLK